jgi:hypothetical protein
MVQQASDESSSEFSGRKADFDAHEKDEPAYPVPRELTSLFYPPWALENTLEAEVFRALFTAVELEVQPQDLFDLMVVAEIAHCFWQQQQVQRSFRDIVRSAKSGALVTILAELVGHDYVQAGELAAQFFSGDVEKRENVVRLLRSNGLDVSSIDAMAMGQRALLLPPLNRMAAALGIRKDQLVEAALERKKKRRAHRATSH